MKLKFRILSLIMCIVMLFTANVVGAEAASVKVAVTEKLVADATAGSVELRWRKVSNASGYKVYQLVDGKYKAIKTVKTNKYVVDDLTASETYKFAVKTYRNYNGKTYWSSKYKSVTVKTVKMAKTPTPKASSTKSTVTLKWSEVEGATGYRVYQYSPSKDKYVVKASIKDATSYKVTGLKENKTYKFKIKPYAKTSGGVVWGKASASVSAQTIDKTKAKFKSPVIGSKGVNLFWYSVSGATAYRLYMVVDGEYVKIASGIKGTSYKVERLESGKDYIFVVRGYKKTNGNVKWYTKSDELKVTTKSAGEPVTKPTEPTTQPSTEPTTEPTTELTTVVTEPTTESATESTTAPTTETTAESTTKPTTTEPVTTAPTTTEPTTTEPVTTAPTTTETTTQKPTETTTQKPTQPTTQKPTETTTQKPTQPTTQKPTETTTQKLTETTTQKPTETTTQKPTEPTTQKPTEPTTQKPTEPTTQPTTQPSDKNEAYRIAKYKEILDKQEIYFKISSKYANEDDVPVEFARNSNGDMYMFTEAEGMKMKLYYTKSNDEMDAYMYLSDAMVDELMQDGSWAMKAFLKSVINLLDSTPLHTVVPDSEKDSMNIDEILDSMMIKNVGNIIVSEDYFNGKKVICERYIDTVTGDTYKYYFDGDKLVGLETIYKNQKLGSDVVVVEAVSNNVDSKLFKEPSIKINLPEGLL